MHNLIKTIKVEIDGNTLQDADVNVFNYIHKVLNNYEKGEYEYGNVKFNIYNKKTLDAFSANDLRVTTEAILKANRALNAEFQTAAVFNKDILVIE